MSRTGVARAGRGPRIVGLAAACGVLGLAAPAGAELLRCEGPDGRTIFTDQAERCPEAEAFEPSGTVHRAESGADPGPRPRRSPETDADEARARAWAQKKQAAEEELEHTSERREWLRSFLAHCNRGGYVTTRDDAGIERTVPCKEIRAEIEGLAAREAELRSYLQGGLQEECRRAGCLPGWIR